MLHPHQRPGRPGFTLIELLVVISIVALLIAVLLPSLNKARVAAMTIICSSGARQTMVASSFYASEYQEFLPSNVSHAQGFHSLLIEKDFASADLFVAEGGCPWGPTVPANDADGFIAQTGDPLRAGIAGSGGTVTTTYGLNGILQSGYGKPDGGPPYTQDGSTGTSWAWYGPQRVSMKRLERFSDKAMVISCSPTTWTTVSRPDAVYRPLLHIVNYYISAWEIPDPNAIRHEAQGLPMVFADGHGEFVPTDVITGGSPVNPLAAAASWYRNYTIPHNIMGVSFNPLYDVGGSVLDD